MKIYLICTYFYYRQPMERIELYKKKNYEGPHDISLIRTTQTVIFEPGKIMPVIIKKNNNSYTKNIRHRIEKVEPKTFRI